MPARWTPEEDAQLGALWATDLYLTDLAKQIGRTRNSCCGRAHRLDLPQRVGTKQFNGKAVWYLDRPRARPSATRALAHKQPYRPGVDARPSL